MSNVLSAGAFNALVWTFTIVSVLITGFRLYFRAFISKAFGLDDGLIVFAQVRIILGQIAT